MRRFLSVSAALLATLLSLGAVRCSFPFGAQQVPGKITIVSYNVCNLFDAEDTGGEYPEYRVASGTWTREKYASRIGNIGAAVQSMFGEDGGTPDILCLMEVENVSVLETLRDGPFRGAGFTSAILDRSQGSSVHCGILSRLPVSDARSHSLEGLSSASRNILEVTYDSGGGSKLHVFVCHWKSRREGAAATENDRIQAAALVRRRVSEILRADPVAQVVVCGDFNEGPDEYERIGGAYPTALMPDVPSMDPASIEGLIVTFVPGESRIRDGVPVLYSPWKTSPGYSYWHRGSGERLDGFLLAPGLLDDTDLAYHSFEVASAPFLFAPDGTPRMWNGSSGYSDHLPVSLTLKRQRGK